MEVGPRGLRPPRELVVHGDQLLLCTGEHVALGCGAHLHHIHEVAEADGLVNGQVAIAVQHAIVDDISAEAHT